MSCGFTSFGTQSDFHLCLNYIRFTRSILLISAFSSSICFYKIMKTEGNKIFKTYKHCCTIMLPKLYHSQKLHVLPAYCSLSAMQRGPNWAYKIQLGLLVQTNGLYESRMNQSQGKVIARVMTCMCLLWLVYMKHRASLIFLEPWISLQEYNKDDNSEHLERRVLKTACQHW